MAPEIVLPKFDPGGSPFLAGSPRVLGSCVAFLWNKAVPSACFEFLGRVGSKFGICDIGLSPVPEHDPEEAPAAPKRLRRSEMPGWRGMACIKPAKEYDCPMMTPGASQRLAPTSTRCVRIQRGIRAGWGLALMILRHLCFLRRLVRRRSLDLDGSSSALTAISKRGLGAKLSQSGLKLDSLDGDVAAAYLHHLSEVALKIMLLRHSQEANRALQNPPPCKTWDCLSSSDGAANH